MSKKNSVFLNGLIYENPTFVQLLGMCPTLAVTTFCNSGFDCVKRADFPAPQGDSEKGADCGIYRHYRRLCNDHRNVSECICSVACRAIGNLYSADRGKLYHLGTRRSVCLEKSGRQIGIGRTGYGLRLYRGALHHFCHPRIFGERMHLGDSGLWRKDFAGIHYRYAAGRIFGAGLSDCPDQLYHPETKGA